MRHVRVATELRPADAHGAQRAPCREDLVGGQVERPGPLVLEAVKPDRALVQSHVGLAQRVPIRLVVVDGVLADEPIEVGTPNLGARDGADELLGLLVHVLFGAHAREALLRILLEEALLRALIAALRVDDATRGHERTIIRFLEHAREASLVTLAVVDAHARGLEHPLGLLRVDLLLHHVEVPIVVLALRHIGPITQEALPALPLLVALEPGRRFGRAQDVIEA